MTFAAQSGFSKDVKVPATSLSLMNEQLTEMPDTRLFRLCQQYGYAALDARRKFAGLLPEVLRRRLYERKGFNSIFEFAAKLAGMSREQVDVVLRLEKRFENMPSLYATLVKGEVSLNKLVRIVSIATPENEQELAEKAKLLSQKALEVLVRDEQYEATSLVRSGENPQDTLQTFQYQNGLFEAKNGIKSLRAHSKVSSFDRGVQLGRGLLLDADVEKELLELQNKGINVNELLREFLEKRKLELAQEKEELSKEQQQKANQYRQGGAFERTVDGAKKWPEKKPSRSIPAKIRHHLKQEYGTKCAKPACHKTAESIHHTARWSLSHNHDPRYLAPLCKVHHEVAHSIDGQYHAYRSLSQQEKRTMVRR